MFTTEALEVLLKVLYGLIVVLACVLIFAIFQTNHRNDILWDVTCQDGVVFTRLRMQIDGAHEDEFVDEHGVRLVFAGAYRRIQSVSRK